jgi:indolepyruvate ferredoxin oxidoreductase beta subunit
MPQRKKLVLASVGGQGGVFLVNLLVTAATLAGLKVGTSEIHGLSQRGGSVTASLTFGANTYGFVDQAQADYMIGLEPLEAQRNLKYLHPDSCAVIDSHKMIPHSVSSQQADYPDTDAFIRYLEGHIRQVIYISGDTPDITPIMRNLYVLGRASKLNDFPVPVDCIQQAIEKMARPKLLEASCRAFEKGVNFSLAEQHINQMLPEFV